MNIFVHVRVATALLLMARQISVWEMPILSTSDNHLSLYETTQSSIYLINI
jgi:hypothetical protein